MVCRYPVAKRLKPLMWRTLCHWIFAAWLLERWGNRNGHGPRAEWYWMVICYKKIKQWHQKNRIKCCHECVLWNWWNRNRISFWIAWKPGGSLRETATFWMIDCVQNQSCVEKKQFDRGWFLSGKKRHTHTHTNNSKQRAARDSSVDVAVPQVRL